MTSREFIQRNFGVPSAKERSCSSVFADNAGNIYSYGHHYPLLFKVGSLTFRNIAGYSNTTSKHIGWCYDFDAIDVKLSGCNQYTWRNPDHFRKVPMLLYSRQHGKFNGFSNRRILQAIVKDLESQELSILAELDSKKRTDTAIYASLRDELYRVGQRLTTVREAL